ncbi:MAG: hypothetical protein ACFNLW_09470 [Olsenella sp.]
MTKDHDINAQEPTMDEVGDGLKAWLTSQGDVPAPEAADGPENASQKDVRQADTPNGSEPQDDTQEDAQGPQDGPVEPAPQEDAADSPEVADEAEGTPQEDASEEDNLAQAYAELQAKVAELEAREAARAEAQEKTNALNAAGIKGNYGQLLTGSKESWAAQIEMLKQFAAENAPAVSIPRDPAVDADLFSDSKEITADEFLRGSRDEF